jgi:hypothetical protein
VTEHSKRSIEQYYAEFPEDDRLNSGRGQLECERTKQIVQRFLPAPHGVVADIGGGTVLRSGSAHPISALSIRFTGTFHDQARGKLRLASPELLFFGAAFSCILQFLCSVVGIDDFHGSAVFFDVPNVVVCQPSVKLHAFWQVTFDILELLASDPEAIQVARDLIGRPHPLEDCTWSCILVFSRSDRGIHHGHHDGAGDAVSFEFFKRGR